MSSSASTYLLVRGIAPVDARAVPGTQEDMRAIWSGSLSFGLVNIPVKLYSATKDQALKFHMVRTSDQCPVGYRRICKMTGDEVPLESISKAYEYEKGEFVVLEKSDFEKANARKTKTLDVVAFVKEQEIDSKYFEKPYFLEPEKKSDHAYVLLREALRKARLVGIVRFVLHNREHIGALKPEGNMLMVEQMRYETEMRSPAALAVPGKQAVAEKEMELARLLIAQLTKPFDPAEYSDTYTEELERVIAEKAKGRKPKKKGQAPQPTAVPDLMSTLMRSLEQEEVHS